MIDTNLKQQVRDAQFNNAVKAARQRKFVAGCAQSGRIYSRAQCAPSASVAASRCNYWPSPSAWSSSAPSPRWC